MAIGDWGVVMQTGSQELTEPASVIVLCESPMDGDCQAYGPFHGSSVDEAAAKAKAWLRRQPCRPRRGDPFWADPHELHCDQDPDGGTCGAWHHISRLSAL